MKKSPWLSRKFWVGIVGFVIMLLNQVAGWDLDPAETTAILLPLIAWILGESWVDGKAAKNK